MTIARILLDEEEARALLERLPGTREFHEAVAEEFIRLQREEARQPSSQTPEALEGKQ